MCSRLFEAGKTNVCDGEIFIITTHFCFSLFFYTCLFSGVKHNTSFLWKIKKIFCYNQKIQNFERNKMHDWNSHLRIDMIQRLTFEHADRMHIFHRKKVFLKKSSHKFESVIYITFPLCSLGMFLFSLDS